MHMYEYQFLYENVCLLDMYGLLLYILYNCLHGYHVIVCLYIFNLYRIFAINQTYEMHFLCSIVFEFLSQRPIGQLIEGSVGRVKNQASGRTCVGWK